MKKRVLILSHDKVGDMMAGVGIRYHYLAEVLAEKFDVTLGAYNPKYLVDHNAKHSYKVRAVDIHDFRVAFDEADVVLALWLSDEMLAYANAQGKVVIFDIYAPVPVEIMAQMIFAHKAPDDQDEMAYADMIRRYVKYFRYGDLFLVSNERQLDFWVGYGFGTGTVTPHSFETADPFRRLAVAPMGIDAGQKLAHTKDVLRGVLPGIGKDDLVLLWTGGLWDWFDAQTVVRAMARLREHKDIKLVFYGIQHPNDEIPLMAETTLTRKLAEELGLTDKTVFFLDGWRPYRDRINYLLESDAAIYAHKPSIEARYSHRTRVIDSHILAGVPTIATAGDYFADEVIAKEGLGAVVPPGDEVAMAEAILGLRDKATVKRYRDNLARVKDEFDWHRVLAPVVEFIEQTEVGAKKPVVVPVDQPILKPLWYRMAKRYLPHRVKRLLVKGVKVVRGR